MDIDSIDTLNTIINFRSSFPLKKLPFPPIILLSHLYYHVSDRTLIDRNLAKLKYSNKIRLFLLPSLSLNDHAILLYEDYISLIKKIFQKFNDQDSSNVLKFFLEKITPNYFDISISKLTLSSLFSTSSISFNIIDRVLIASGLLIVESGSAIQYQMEGQNYFFSVPFVGPFISDIKKGRTEIFKIIQKQKFHQIPLELIVQKRLKTCSIPTEYLIHDMLGMYLLKIENSCAGPIIQIY